MNEAEAASRKRLVKSGVPLIIGVLVLLMLAGCGGKDSETGTSSPTESPSTSSEAATPSTDSKGVTLAKRILATFDELVGKEADLTKDKPDATTLQSRLQGWFESYTPKMIELNTEYLALRESDIAQFGECNAYLGDYRSQHVTEKDNTLSEALRYYNLELGDQETVSLLSDKPVELLDMAVKQN